MSNSRLIELSLDIELVDPEDAVLPSEVDGPTIFEIEPQYSDHGETEREVVFRVKFEPDNHERRKQPYRESVKPVFPKGWKYGDPWKDDKNKE